MDYVLLQSLLGDDFHKETLEVIRAENLGDNTPHYLVPSGILNDQVVVDAVELLLGPSAEPDVCRHIHTNLRPENGDWHQDDYDGKPWPEGKWAILFYFPQDTPPEMGGTGILFDGHEVVSAGPAGTCLLARSDVTHRARANTAGKQRYMLKYLFHSK